MSRLVAVSVRVQERADLGPAVVGMFSSYEATIFAVMSRVVCHAAFFGRWLGEDFRVVAEYDQRVQICQDVTFEMLSMYAAANLEDAEAAKLLVAMRSAPRKRV